MTLVALSASYGAGGSRIGPALARELAVPFLDRAIPMRAAAALDVPGEDDRARPAEDDLEPDEEASGSWLERVLRGFAGAEVAVPGPVPAEADDPDHFRRHSEEQLREFARGGRGVILGRAAVVVLQEDPRVLRVRLDGPPERRIEQAVSRFGADPEEAARAVRKLDRTHDAYLRRFYGADIHDPGLYHLVIDSTAVPLEACVEMVAVAARARAAGAG